MRGDIDSPFPPPVSSTITILSPTASPPNNHATLSSFSSSSSTVSSRTNKTRDRRRSFFTRYADPSTDYGPDLTGRRRRIRNASPGRLLSPSRILTHLARPPRRPVYLYQHPEVESSTHSAFLSRHGQDDLWSGPEMPFRKNHALPEYGVDQCMNPQLANRTVLRCERPYYDPRAHASYRYGDQLGRSSEEDMGSGRSVAGPVRVKEEPTGWVSPFESWHGLQQQQTQPLGRSAGPPLPMQMQTHQTKFESESYRVEQRNSGPPRMQYQVQQPPTGYYQYSPPSHLSGPQAGDYQASPTRSFDMQPMALTMPTVQQSEFQRPLTAHAPLCQSAPAVSGSLNTSVGARPGPGGQYYEEYAASTPSTTSSVPVYAPPPRSHSQSRVQSQPHSQGLFERRSYNNWHPSGSEQSNESPETRTDGSSPYARPGQGVTSPVPQDPNVSPSGYGMSGLADGPMGGPVQMSLGGRPSAGGLGLGGGESVGGSGGQDVASIQAGLAAEAPFTAISAAKTAGSTTTGVENGGGGGGGGGAASAGKAVKKKAAKGE